MRTAAAKKLSRSVSDVQTRPAPGLRLVSNSPPSDYALARAASDGAMDAIGDLYKRYNQRVYSVCLGMTRNPSEAEDLTQEVFIHLLRKIGSFRGESQFSTWLHRLTVNLVLMHFRRKARLKEQLPADADKTFPLAPDPPRSHIADVIALRSALAALPSGCRAVFVLFDIAGYKHDEIAKLLGCSAGTSKSQLHRARVKLRQSLSSAEPGKPTIVKIN